MYWQINMLQMDLERRNAEIVDLRADLAAANELIVSYRKQGERLGADLAAAKALLQDVLNECACKGRIVSTTLVDRIAAAIAGSKT